MVLLKRHPENEVKLKRIIKFIVVYVHNYRQRHANVSVIDPHSIIGHNELSRPCPCGTDPALMNEFMNKGKHVCYKQVILR